MEGEDTVRIESAYRFPPINPDDYDQNLKGEISIEIEIHPYRVSLPDKKFQFEVYIYDKTLNKSNVIVSPIYDL